jgi:PAS domain S-box-containing protein
MENNQNSNINRELDELKIKLVESEDRYNFLFDTTTQGVLIHNNGKPVQMNKAFLDIVGYTQQELMQLNLVDILVSAQSKKTIQNKILTQDTNEYETQLLKKSGDVIHVLIECKNAVFNGESVRVVLLTDLTQSIKLELRLKESEENFKMLNQHFSDVIWVIDIENQKLLYINAMVEKLRGYTPEEALNQNLVDSLTPESLNHLKGVVAARLELFKTGQAAPLL